MAQGQVSARISGDEYQAMTFWYYASQLLDKENQLKKVIFENDKATGVDDICIIYSEKGFNDNGSYISNDYIQVKYHVDKSNTYSSDKLMDPSFINSKTSLLKKFWIGFNKIYIDEQNIRLILISNWNWDQSDSLFSLIREESNNLPKSFFSNGPRSKIGKIRESWKTHLSIDQSNISKFEVFCKSLRFKVDWLSKSDLKQSMNDRLKANHLVPVDNATNSNPYVTIYNRLLIADNNIFTKNNLIELLLRESLVQDSYHNLLETQSLSLCCNNHNELMVKKMIANKKYIPGVFVETGLLKEQIRYITNPKLFIGKILDKIKKIDYAYLNRYLHKEKIDISEYKSATKEYIDRNYEQDIESIEDIIQELEEKIKSDLERIKPLHDHEKSLLVFGKRSFSYKLRSHAYMLKNAYEDILEHIGLVKSRVVILIDSAGKGKTNLVCDLFQNYFNRVRIDALFFIGSDFVVNDEFDIEKYIINKLNYSGLKDFNSLLNIIYEECVNRDSYFIFVIDGINENNNLKTFSKALLMFIEKLINYSKIKMLCTCRSEYFNERFTNLMESSFCDTIFLIEHRINDDRTKKEKIKLFTNYMQFYNINSSSIKRNARKALSNDPLLLRFFCEAYGHPGSDSIVILPYMVDINREEIFRKYQESKVDNISKKLIEDGLVSTVMSGNRKVHSIFTIITNWIFENLQYNNIPISVIEKDSQISEKIIFKIIDEDILFRKDIDSSTGEEVLNFTFDEYRDYILAKALLDILNENNDDFLRKYNAILGTKNIDNNGNLNSWNYHSAKEGITKYLFLIGRERKDLNLEDILGIDEYTRFYSSYIFEVDQNCIRDEEIEHLKTIFLSKQDSKILQKLLVSWDLSVFPKLNLKLLLSWLKDLPQNVLDFKYQVFMRNETDFVESLFNLCDSLLDDEDFYDDESFHTLFESLIFLFGSVNNKHVLRAFNLYNAYQNIVPKKAIKVLIEYMNICDRSIQEYVASLLLVLSFYHTEKLVQYSELLLRFIKTDDSNYLENIITRDYIKNVLLNIHKKNGKIFSSRTIKMIQSINTPAVFLSKEDISPCRSSEEQDHSFYNGPIDYDIKKTYLSWISHKFGLHRCDASDEILNSILPNLGYNQDDYKTIERKNDYNYYQRNENEISFGKKYLWQAIRILQGKWIDNKPYKKEDYDDYNLDYDLIDFFHRKFDPFFFTSPKDKRPDFFSPIKMPQNEPESWINEKRELPKKSISSIVLEDKEWVVIDAHFSQTNSEKGYTTFFILDSYFIDNSLTYSYSKAIKHDERQIDNENRVNICVFKNEINKLFQRNSDKEYISSFHISPPILKVDRSFELNSLIDDSDYNLHFLEEDIVSHLELNLEEDFSYTKDNEEVVKIYSWGDGFKDYGYLHMIQKSLLEKYLQELNLNLVFSLCDERSIYKNDNKYSKKAETIFYILPKAPDNFNEKELENYIEYMGIVTLRERWIATRLFEIRDKKNYKDEVDNIYKYLDARMKERLDWEKKYKNIKINFSLLKGDEDENTI